LTGADDTKKVLKAKGRDISPFEVYLELQVKDRSGWVAVDAPAAPEKELGALRQRILNAVLAIGPCGPGAITKFTGDKPSTVRVYLPRMVKDGQLVKDSSGIYGLVADTPSILGVAGVAPVAEDPATVTPATLLHLLQPPTTVTPTQADPPAQNEDPADNDLTTWENIEEYSPDQESDPADWWQDPRDNDTDTQSDPPEYTPEPDSESKSSAWDSYLDSYHESNPQSQHESLDPPEATQRTPPPLLRAAHLPFGSGNSVEGGGEPSRYAPLAETIQCAAAMARLDQEVAPEAAAATVPAPAPSVEDRLLAVMDATPQNFTQLATAMGIHISSDLSLAIYRMIERGAALKTVVGGRIYVARAAA
jgi:hypothetical protein